MRGAQWRSKETTAIIVLALYLFLNVSTYLTLDDANQLADRFSQQCSITLLNKFLLHVPCPYLLTASHTNATFVACKLIRRDKRKTHLHRQAHFKLLCFSFLYTINISISNASLGLVTLPVHQAIRATAPVLTVLLAKALPSHLSMRFGWKTYITLLPIVTGALLATYGGRYDADVWGLFLTMTGAGLAVAKTIGANSLLHNTQLSLHPIELLGILSPYATAQAFLWAIWKEEFGILINIAPASRWFAMVIVLNTAIAAALNIVSFEANRRGGPLAMAITANLKQVILLAVPLEGELPGPAVVLGTALTIVGSFWYAYVRPQDEEVQQCAGRHILPKSR